MNSGSDALGLLVIGKIICNIKTDLVEQDGPALRNPLTTVEVHNDR
jgi:hypothetical protein